MEEDKTANAAAYKKAYNAANCERVNELRRKWSAANKQPFLRKIKNSETLIDQEYERERHKKYYEEHKNLQR
jgi:hypothetical protein